MSRNLEFVTLYTFWMTQEVAVYFKNYEETTDFYTGFLSVIPLQKSRLE